MKLCVGVKNVSVCVSKCYSSIVEGCNDVKQTHTLKSLVYYETSVNTVVVTQGERNCHNMVNIDLNQDLIS